jgi:hypothetical protein
MSTPELFEQDDLTIRVQEQPQEAKISWHGTSDARDPGSFLNPFLKGLSDSLKGKAVVLDFHDLQYMNSGTVAPIINFVRALNAQGSNTTIFYDKSRDWQRINFQVLGVIAATMKNLHVEGR